MFEVSDDPAKIANRQAARLLSRLEQNRKLSDMEIEEIQKFMHYTAQDVAKSMAKNGEHNGNQEQ